MLLQLFHLSYQLKKTVILEDIHLQFDESGLVLITGPSGCGKSTLLHLIGGFIPPSEGEVVINGVSYNNKYRCDKDQIHQNDVSFIFQGYHLIEAMSVEDNLKLFGFEDFKIKEVLEKVEMFSYLKVPIEQLSGGQKQRIAIARVLLIHPKIILADEPTAALDFETAKLVRSLLIELAKDTLIIVVSHDVELFKDSVQRKICLANGKVLSDQQVVKTLPVKKYVPQSFNFNTKCRWKYIGWSIYSKRGKLVVCFVSQLLIIAIIMLIFALSGGISRYLSRLQSYSFSQNELIIYKSDDPTQIMTEEDVQTIENWEGVQQVRKNKAVLNLESENKALHFIELPSDLKAVFMGKLPETKEEVIVSYDVAKELSTSLNEVIGTTVYYQLNNIKQAFVISGYSLDPLSYKCVYFSPLLGDDLQRYEEKGITVVFNDYTQMKKIIKEKSQSTTYSMSNDFYEFENNIQTLVTMVNSVLSIFAFITMIMNALMCYLLNYASFLQKRKEIIMLRVYGISRWQIWKIYFYENIILSLGTTIVGGVFGCGVILVINQWIPRWIDPSLTHLLVIPYQQTGLSEFQFPMFVYWLIMVLLIIVNGLAISLSLFRIFKKDAGQILREDDLC